MRKVFTAFEVAVLSLGLLAYQPSYLALAQDEPAAAPAAEEVQVSSEAQASVEEDLTASAEAAQELAIDLDVELGHEGYDGLVPADGFWGKVAYPLKEASWDVQEGLYNVFASDATYAELEAEHADLHLLDATKQIAGDPASGETVAAMLEQYKNNIESVEGSLAGLKKQDPTFAKSLAATVAEEHGLIAPRVLGTLVDGSLTSAPETSSQLLDIKNAVLESAVGGIAIVADNQDEFTQALQTITNSQQRTPFSGVTNAEFLSQAKVNLADKISTEIGSAIDQVINLQLKTVEQNLKNLSATDEVKAGSFQKFMAQMPDQSLARMKIVDQFKSQSDFSPVMIASMQEIKAKVAENIGAKIKSLIQDEVRKAFSQAMLEIKNPNFDDFKILNEFQDMVPDEEVRREITANHEQQVQKFLTRFGSDANAKQVTGEFDSLMKKVQAGQITPDANFFKTLEGLKTRLNPEQQQYINQMEQTGKQEMANRMQNDQFFAERFSTFNPGDMAVYEKIGEQGFGAGQGFNFQDKFREIEQQQAQSFTRYLDFQSRPEDVQAIQQQFQNTVPQEIRSRFETRYNFNPETFQKQEQFAREKEDFFKQKFEDIQKQYQEKFGNEGQGGQPGGFPGQGQPFQGGFPGGFPGAGGFGFPGFQQPFFQQGQQGGNVPPGFVGPPIEVGANCPIGMVQGPYGCQFKYEQPKNETTCPQGMITTPFGCEPVSNDRPYPYPKPGEEPRPIAEPYCPPGQHYVNSFGCQSDSMPTNPTPFPPSPINETPAQGCTRVGGTWSSDGYCHMPGDFTPPNVPTPTPTPSTDSMISGCNSVGGTWTGSYCKMPNTTTDAATNCASTGGRWDGTACQSAGCGTGYVLDSTNKCVPSSTTPTPTPTPTPSPTPTTSQMQTDCVKAGGTWVDNYCKMPTTSPTPSPTPTPTPSPTTPSTSDMAANCAAAGGSWDGTACHMPTTSPTPSPTPTPSPSPTTYPTPESSYQTPPPYQTPASPPPTSYAGPQVAGIWTMIPKHDLGPFDFLALFGLGVYSYMKKRKKGEVELG